MRLTPDQTHAIQARIRACMGPNARIWLFGSRVDDSMTLCRRRLTTQRR